MNELTLILLQISKCQGGLFAWQLDLLETRIPEVKNTEKDIKAYNELADTAPDKWLMNAYKDFLFAWNLNHLKADKEILNILAEAKLKRGLC